MGGGSLIVEKSASCAHAAVSCRLCVDVIVVVVVVVVVGRLLLLLLLLSLLLLLLLMLLWLLLLLWLLQWTADCLTSCKKAGDLMARFSCLNLQDARETLNNLCLLQASIVAARCTWSRRTAMCGFHLDMWREQTA